MSNARNLANLLSPGASTLASAAIADDAITAAKIDDDGTGFKVADLEVTGNMVGNISGRFLLDASASSTDVGENILLDGTDGSATNAGSNLLFDAATEDGSAVINSGEGHAISGNATEGQILQVQSVVDNVDRTFSGNQQIVYASLPASTAGFLTMTKTVTPISSRSKFYVFVKSHQCENTNTDNGESTTLFCDTDFLAYNGGSLFTYSGGVMSVPQTNPINMQAVYFGKHQAGVDITFNVRAGSAGTNTGAVRINNGGGLPTAVTGFAVASSMVIMEVL